MSWRDRLPKRDPGDFSGPANRAEGPFDTTGAIGNQAFLTTGRTVDAAERSGPDHGLSSAALPGSHAFSVKRAQRADTYPHIATETDASSAESVDSTDNPHPAETERDASSAESANSGDDGTWGDAQEERAAIVEYDGDIPRAWAEGFARLDPDRPPRFVPAKRWRLFVDDVGRFLDGGWVGKATALGWGPYDLFGADRDRPFARVDCAGLVWLLNGDRLLALTESAALIETRTGARHTYRRKRYEPGCALPWEIAQ
jgi:hypothetical protein